MRCTESLIRAKYHMIVSKLVGILKSCLLIPYFVHSRFACRTPKNPKNIIFSPWGHENIYNGMT